MIVTYLLLGEYRNRVVVLIHSQLSHTRNFPDNCNVVEKQRMWPLKLRKLGILLFVFAVKILESSLTLTLALLTIFPFFFGVFNRLLFVHLFVCS